MKLEVKYYPETDSVVIATGERGGSGRDLRNDGNVILTYAREGKKTIAMVEVFSISLGYLPLAPERGYDAATDTLTLGEKPVGDYLTEESGEFVSYLQPDPGRDWYEVRGLDIRNASKHLKQVNDRILRKQKQDPDKLRVIQ